MNKKTQDLLLVIFMAILLFVLSAFCLFKKETAYSEDERRVLASRPELTADSLLFGSFMTQFEDYARDQFPFRDSFRSVKAFSALYLFQQKDSNGYYVENGYKDNFVYGPLHGTGIIEVEAPWVETTSNYKLQPNMTFQIDTFISTDTFGVRWEKGIAVTETGCDILSPEIGTLYELEV